MWENNIFVLRGICFHTVPKISKIGWGEVRLAVSLPHDIPVLRKYRKNPSIKGYVTADENRV